MMSGEPSVDMCGSAPMEIYTKKLNLLQKIFGYGPDTFALIMQYYYPGEMQNGRMVIFDSAHNEYLHYLVTTGFVGMASYLYFMISSIVAMAKRSRSADRGSSC